MLVAIAETDEISRCIVFDRAFEDQLHVDAFLWRFEKTAEDGRHHESGVLRSLAPADDDVHRIGCSIAATQNARKDPPPGPKRRYYCGFRTAVFSDLPTSGNGFEIAILHLPENGENAHVDVAVTITVEGKNARANCRTEAGLALAEQFGPPVAHRCVCDSHDEFHPFDRFGRECLIKGLEDRWPALKICDMEASNDVGQIHLEDPQSPA